MYHLDNSSSESEEWRAVFKMIAVINLKRGMYQPRTEFDEEGLQSLSETIRKDGVLEPILVRRLEEGNNYEIIAGERRWRAAQLAGLHEVPCLIRNYTDEQAARVSLIENIAREDLDPISQAKAMAKIINEFGYTHQEMASVVGKTRTVVTNSLRLLKLDERVQDFIRKGQISEAHGKILVGVSKEKQYLLSLKIIKNGLTTHFLEKHIEEIENDLGIKSNKVSDVNTMKLAQQVSDYLGYKVLFNLRGNKSGNLVINFANLDQLDGILSKIGYLRTNSDF